MKIGNNNFFKKCSIGIAAFLFIFLVASFFISKFNLGAKAVGETIYVNAANGGFEDGSEANPYNTIQEGVDAVSGGGTVYVATAEYPEWVTIDGKTVTIAGTGGFPVVNPTGGGFFQAPFIVTASGNATIDNFHIQGDTTGLYSQGVMTVSHCVLHTSGFYSNTTAATAGSGSINAVDNYWGGSGSIAISSSVSGNVTYSPWYLDSGMTILSSSDVTGPTVALSNNIGNRNTVRRGETVRILATIADSGGLDDTHPPIITINPSITDPTFMTQNEMGAWYYDWNVTSDNRDDITISVEAPDIVGNAAQAPTGVNSYTIVADLTENQVAPDVNGNVAVNPGQTEVVLDPSSTPANITIPDTVTTATLNLSAFTSGGIANDVPEINLSKDTGGGVLFNVEIPSGTDITAVGDVSWSGVLNVPEVTSITTPGTFDSAIEVGLPDTELTFNNAVKLTFEGKAGKSIGFKRSSSAFTEITTLCSDIHGYGLAVDKQAFMNDHLGDGSACKIDSGADLVVWTKHFTTFATYTSSTPTPAPPSAYIPPVGEEANEGTGIEPPLTPEQEEVLEQIQSGDSLDVVQTSPIPEFDPVWGSDYPDGRVDWALAHRQNIYNLYISILGRRPTAIEVNWWLTQEPNISVIRYQFLASDEYKIKNP